MSLKFDGRENLHDLVGKTLTSIDSIDGEKLIFRCDNGDVYEMYHDQDCCESVYIEDINGDLYDLIGIPIVDAYENSNFSTTDYGDENWTFYHLSTVKGSVVIRWYGTSNGYYSTSVSFARWIRD